MEDKLTLMRQEYKSKIAKSIDNTKTLLYNSFARLLFFDTKNNWRDTNICGPLAVIFDRSRKGPMLQILSPENSKGNLDLLFECEIYINFSQSFCTLEVDHASVVAFIFNQRYFALQFPCDGDLKAFVSKVKGIEEKCKSSAELRDKLKAQEENIK